MPPALCLPPTILDQSFPRDTAELDRAVESLGALQGLVDGKKAYILLTSTLEGFLELFEWQTSESGSILNEIHRLIAQWLLQPTSFIRRVKTDGIDDFAAHPLPSGCKPSPLVDLWREETGKIYTIYSTKCGGVTCVGLACDHAFSGSPCGEYPSDADLRRFPLVGPSDLRKMDDFDRWVLPETLHTMDVSFHDARKNIPVIGGIVAKKPVGSHYKVKFKGAPRSWVLDRNDDPLPDRYLGQLQELVKLPVSVIRYALIYGMLPGRVPFF